MLNRPAAAGLADERVALKDENLVYRACSRAFARSLGAASPEDVIGKTDFDLLPHAVAREQMALDSRAVYLAQPDISTIELRGRGGASRRVMIVRTPVTSSGGQVCGMDIRLIGEGDVPPPRADPDVVPAHAPSTHASPADPARTLRRDGDPAEGSSAGSGVAGSDPFRSDRVGDDLVAGDPGVNLRRLRADEQRFRHYASSAADFFWELDAGLVFRVVSDDIEKVLGLSMDQLIGRTHRQLSGRLADASDPDHWRRHLDSLDRHEQFRDFEFRRSVDGGVRVIRYSGLPLFDRQGRFVGYRGVGGDVTASVRQAEVLAYHASHDGLTGLLNRQRFEKTLRTALETYPLRSESHALCFMDLDRFKVVNDTCGHLAGDELLRQLTRLLDSLVRKSDVLARLGGDEFGVLLYRCDMAGALKLANQIRSEVERFEFLWEGKRFTIGVSAGLVVVDDRWESVDSLFSAADSACYIAKNEGRNRVVVYREAEGRASNRKVAIHWADEIGSALADDRLRIACQPIRSLRPRGEGEDEEGVRLEVLIRLRQPDGELVSPRAFLPAAERHGLSAALDERAVSLTLDWLTAFPDRLSDIRHVSINLASGSFTDAGFAERLIALLENSGVAGEKLCFELSETTAIAHLAKASEFMRRLAVIGCRFGIDDFGSSLSSFAWMRDLPIDFVKIDGRLVKNILADPVDLTTVRAIGDISRSMGTRTVAEFVESSDLLETLRTIGIDFAQGYHVGRPELVELPERQPAH